MIKGDAYYINEIKVNEWLVENLEGKRSIIRFANRTEYYLGEELHNEDGAAIVWGNKNGSLKSSEYYLFGEKYNDKLEWKKVATKLSRTAKINNIFSEDEQNENEE